MIEFVEVEGLGRVRVSRRAGSRSMRLSVTQNGEVRLSMPPRMSLQQGLKFLEEKRSWLRKHSSDPSWLEDGARIGKAHILVIVPSTSTKSHTTLTANKITVHIPEHLDADEVQDKLQTAARKALKKESEVLLPQQLMHYADAQGYQVHSVGVKALQSRWGSCSGQNDIILNTFLMQLPWPLIDYVLIHELSHTKHHNHSAAFWAAVGQVIPGYKLRRTALKKYPTAVFDGREIDKFR